MAESGFQFGGSSGGASILDLHSGALSKGKEFVNVYKFPGAQKVFESSGAISTYRVTLRNLCLYCMNGGLTFVFLFQDVKTKISHAISDRFGVNVESLYLTHPTFFSRITNVTAKTIHDEYWHPHVDKVRYCLF